MKLMDLRKPLQEMTEQELLEQLRQVRHNRFIERPAAKARVAREEAKEERKQSRKGMSKIDRLLDSLSPEQREALAAQIQERMGLGNGNDGQVENDPSGEAGGGGQV